MDNLQKEREVLASLEHEAANPQALISEVSQAMGFLANVKNMLVKGDKVTAGRYANMAEQKISSIVRGVKTL